jgi:quinoprotein glucose dehydrogenase
MTEDDITNISPEATAFVKKRLSELPKTTHQFAPPNVEGTILFGYSGGAEWGGNAMDQDGILYQNSNDDPWLLQMIDTESRIRKLLHYRREMGLYIKNCASCHGEDRKGSGQTFPSLIDIGSKKTAAEIATTLKQVLEECPLFRSYQMMTEN